MNLLPCNVSLLPYGQNDAIISCSRDNVVSQWCVLAVCNWFSANILMQAHSSVNYTLRVEFAIVAVQHCSEKVVLHGVQVPKE